MLIVAQRLAGGGGGAGNVPFPTEEDELACPLEDEVSM
jgi:hypothetical protein